MPSSRLHHEPAPRRATDVLHHRHDRRHRDAARPGRDRRRAPQRSAARAIAIDADRARTAALNLADADVRHPSAPATVSLADRVVVTFFPAPQLPYTGDDVVETQRAWKPRGPARDRRRRRSRRGARLAEPGEFTLRAFLNGRIDLPQAEAVADLIDAVTPLQARAAFDQLKAH